jgi:hypothetical protein
MDLTVDPSFTSLEELSSSQPEMTLRVKDAVTASTDFLAQFRADSIVRDAEAVKDALLHKSDDGASPWGCALGQSFGGFCLLTYMSQIQRPPTVCLLTGGVAPILTCAYDVYTALLQKVKDWNLKYYSMYPGDIPIVKLIVKTLMEEPVPLPSGGLLTARRFLQSGMALAGDPKSFATMHGLVSTAFLETDEDELEFKVSFLKRMDSFLPFDDNPLYFWLHEAMYADGPSMSPTNWAAHRAYEEVANADKEFDYRHTCTIENNGTSTLFFGEMVFPWMLDDYEELGSGVGMKALAQRLATKEDWGSLYDCDNIKNVLENGACSAAAAIYFEDAFVDFNASMKVTSRHGPLERCKVWVTNEYQHNGIEKDGAKIFSRLHNMAKWSKYQT